MFNKQKRNTIFASATIAAITSISAGVVIMWTWSNTKEDYNLRYQQVKNILTKLNLPKKNIEKKFNSIDPNYKSINQFKQLDKVVELILTSLKKSINSKEENLKTLNIHRKEFKDEFDMMDYNDSLNYINEFDSLINNVQDPKEKETLIDNLLKDTRSQNSKLQLDNLKKVLEEQQREINENKVEISKIISTFPKILRDKFNKKLDNSQNNLNSLRNLKSELEKYEPIVEKAQKIKNLFKQSEVYVDLNNAETEELPIIEDKIDKILKSENLSEFDRKKDQVKNLINVVEDEGTKNDFLEKLDEIDKIKTMPELLELEKEVENYLKSNSGLQGLINFKKKELNNKINESNLPEEIKQKYLDDIKVSSNLDELSKIESEIDELIAIDKRKKEVEEIIKLLNNPKKDELLRELSLTNDLEVIDRISDEATKILSEETKKTRKVIQRLKGLPRLKNDFELILSDAKTQGDIQEVASDVNDYMNDLIDEANEIVNSLDNGTSVIIGEQTVSKSSLEKELENLSNTGNAGEYSEIIEKANALKNYVNSKQKGSEIVDLLDDKQKGADLKEKLKNAKTLDDTLKVKAEIDRLYQFQLDKAKAKKAIESVIHNDKKSEFTKRLNDATTSDELVILTSEANAYHNAEESNKLTHDQLKYFVDENVGDQSKKEEFKKKLDDAMVDQQGKNNIDQDQVETKLREIRDEINELIKAEKDAAEALRLKKEQIKADIENINDKDKANQFNDELIDVLTIEQAEKLQEKVDQQLEFEKTKRIIKEKVSKLEDKKDYLNESNNATSIDQLKDIDSRIDQDLKREAQELKEAKDDALEKIVDIADSNALKAELFDAVEKAKTKLSVAKIVEKVDNYLNELKEKAITAIATTVGDDKIHNELNADLGGAKNEVLLKDIIKKANESFSNKKTEVIDELSILDDNHSTKEEFKDRLKNASNISDLNDLLEEVKNANNIETIKNNLRKKMEQVQEGSEKQKLSNLIDQANSREELSNINEQIDGQIQKEKDEIQANKDIVNEKIKELYKDENINLFNKQTSKDDLGLEESRRLIENIEKTIAVEQNELKNKINEAENEILNTLLESPERNDILLQAESSKSLDEVDVALRKLNERIELLKEEARIEAKKLISNSDMLTTIKQAKTQKTIDQIKVEAIQLFNSKKQAILEKLDQKINVSTDIHDEIQGNINTVENEIKLNELSSLIDDKLFHFNRETENQVNRLVDKSSILPIENWTNENISLNQRNSVQNIINKKWTNYLESLKKLEGDTNNHKKYEDILTSLDKAEVSEAILDQYIDEMNNIFDSRKDIVSANIQSITNEDTKLELNKKLLEAKNIEDLNELQRQADLQHKKEELINSLPTKIVFEDQKLDFENRINNSTNIDQLTNPKTGLEKEINDKQIYNSELLKELEFVNALNDKINVTTEKHNEFKKALDSSRTKEEVSEIKRQINEFIKSKKSEVATFIEKLVGSNEKEIKEEELKNATSETEIQSILDVTKKIFSNKQDNIKETLEELTDETAKNNFNNAIENAINFKNLDDIKDKINNQKLREEIQRDINKLSNGEEKKSLQEELNSISNDKTNKLKLTSLKDKVDNARAKQEGDFAISKEKATKALEKLLPTNNERIRLEGLLKTYTNDQTDSEKVKKVEQDAIAELEKIKNEIKEESKQNIQPRGRDKESPSHTEKYNEFNELLESATTEKRLRDISSEMITYVNDVKDLYKKYVDANLPIENIREEIKTNLVSKTKINDLDAVLKDANKKTKVAIDELLNTIEDTNKKNELKQKLVDATSNDNVEPTITKWRNELSELKSIYDDATSFRNNEKRELEDLRNDIKNKINNSLNDNQNDSSDNSKAKLLELIDTALTKSEANEVLKKLNSKINSIKEVARQVVEKTKGSNLYDNLKQEINSTNIDTEQEILLIQQKASEEFEKNKKSTEDSIALVHDANKKAELENEKNTAQNVGDLNNVKNKAILEAKKEELKELVKELWDQKEYNNNIEVATTLEQLNEIEKLINNDKNEQDLQLKSVKEKARVAVNKLEDKNNKLTDIENATTLEAVNKIKNDAIEVIRSLKEEIKPLLAKIEGSNNYDAFELRNNDEANELELKQLKNDLISEFDTLKSNTKNKINEQGSYKNNTVIVDQYDKKEKLQAEAENANNYSELHNIENTAKVEKYAKYVKDEINKVLDKENMLEQVEEILKNRPSTDDEKQNKINALEQIAQKARKKARSELAELNLAKENAKREIKEKVNLSSEKQQEFIGWINQSNTKEEVQNVINDVNKFISDEKTKVENDLINKLTENKNPKNKLKTSLDNATSETEIANIKNEAIAELNKFKNNAEIALERLSENIQGQNNHSDFVTKLNGAKTTDTQKAYEDVVNEVEKQIEKLKTWAKSNLEQINDQEEKNKIKELIESADTSLKLKELENRVNLTIAREKAENAIKKLSDTNEQKNQLLNFIYSSNSLQDIATKQAEAEKIINDKKKEATDAVAKLEGDLTYVKSKEDLAKADNEDQLNNLIRLSNETFNNKKDEIRSEINKLILDKDLMSTDGLDTVKKLKDYSKNTIIPKALEYTNSKITEVADETKKQELEQMLKNKSQVDDINEVYNLAVAELDRENALENAKTKAKELAKNELSDEDLESFNTKISQANTIEEVNAIKRDIQAKVDDKNRELTKLKNKFLDSNEVKKNVENASKNSVKEIEKLIKNLQNEKTQIISKTSSDLEKIHVTEKGLLTVDKMNDENSKYNAIKLEFDSINDSNWTEENDKLISSKVDQAILSRKNKARDHINSLDLDKDTKDQLINELNSGDTNTYTKIIKLEKKADRELRVKNIKDKISKINDENVRNDLNNRANSDNENLDTLETDVEGKLKEQEDAINLYKEEAREEVKKLPLSEQKTKNDNIDSATTQDQIDTIKQSVIQRMGTLRKEVQDEIEKMPLNARKYLSDKKDSVLDNGDELLSLKEIAIETVSESNKLKEKNESEFSNEQEAKEFFDSKINSSIADSKEKIKSLSNDFEIIKNKLKTLRTKQAELGVEYKNQFDSLVSDAFKDLNKEIIGNNSVNSMLDSIIEKINFRKKQNDAIKAIKDKFEDQNQTVTTVNDINNLTSNDERGLETLVTNANNLFNNLQSLKNTINSIGKESNRTSLLEEWKKVDTLSKKETLDLKVNSFKTTLASVQQELNNLDNRSNQKQSLQTELDMAGTKEAAENVRSKIKQEKAKNDWESLKARLNNGDQKTNWDNIVNSAKSTSEQIDTVITDATKYLESKRQKAISTLERLNEDNSIRSNSTSKTTIYNTESEYDNLINNSINFLNSEAKKTNILIGKLKETTKKTNDLSQFTFDSNNNVDDSVTESKINNDSKKVEEILKRKYNDVKDKLNILNGSSERETYKTKLGSEIDFLNKTETQYDTLISEIDGIYNEKHKIAERLVNYEIKDPSKKLEFNEKFRNAANLGDLNTLINELNKYYELLIFKPKKDNNSSISQFNWYNEDVVGEIQLNKVEGDYKDKYIYLVVKSSKGDNYVVSKPILLNNSNLKFNFPIKNFIDDGHYDLHKVVVLDYDANDNNVILSSKNIINNKYASIYNFNIKLGTITANNVSMSWNNLKEAILDENSRPQGAEMIEKSVDANVQINGFTAENIDISSIKNIRIHLKGEANTGNSFTNDRFNNVTLIDRLELTNENSNILVRKVDNTDYIFFDLKAKGMKAGYVYNLDKIEFDINRSHIIKHYVYNKVKKDNDENSINYSENYSYKENTNEAISWLFELKKSDRDKLLTVKEEYPNNRSYKSILEFNDGWDIYAFSGLFRYLNSFVPDIGSNLGNHQYKKEDGTSVSLRERWKDYLINKLTQIYKDKYNKDKYYATIPTNRRWGDGWSLSFIQLGIDPNSYKEYTGMVIHGTNTFAPVLGGRNVEYDFQHSPKYFELMKGFMYKRKIWENGRSVWAMWLKGAGQKSGLTADFNEYDESDLKNTIRLAIEFVLEFGATNYIGDKMTYPTETIKNK
ncbi:hypothetical protein [Mycoplasma sp. CSL10166]|uniref:hypothetical protein n=1 Tax=Mycoplasma sp. CSL10166 TaxID=2813825 RepID=UPI00197C0E7E|nr:hypothetical protein [Mycoplasma sp. CSL10166]MBN4084517.1 hypothetical protein [Mycoplasma sp. CSL10166]